MTTKWVRLSEDAEADATPVAVEPLGDDRYRVTVGDDVVELAGRRIEGGVAIRMGDRSLEIPVDARNDRSVVHVEGRRVDVQLQSERLYAMQQALGVGAGGADRELVSPMTGKVVLVAAAAGDEVGEGRTIVVIEAMKMENELRTVADVVVDTVHVAPGDLVNPGDVLVTFVHDEDGS